jgi:prepilin-type N-terminal cleavage/methylation domain-containing protein
MKSDLLKKNSSGFTLIEVLVTTALIGILAVLSSIILINTTRNSNKANITNEAKENLALVAEYLARDIRSASDATALSATNLRLNNPDGSWVDWFCVAGGAGVNNYIRRQLTSSAGAVLINLPITNRDPLEGVSYTNCVFRHSGSLAGEKSASLEITFQEGKGISSGPQDLGVSVSQTITAFTRGY